MDEYENLDSYNGDPIHDMYVDSDFEMNTGEIPYVFDEDDFIDNLDDWD